MQFSTLFFSDWTITVFACLFRSFSAKDGFWNTAQSSPDFSDVLVLLDG